MTNVPTSLSVFRKRVGMAYWYSAVVWILYTYIIDTFFFYKMQFLLQFSNVVSFMLFPSPLKYNSPFQSRSCRVLLDAQIAIYTVYRHRIILPEVCLGSVSQRLSLACLSDSPLVGY